MPGSKNVKKSFGSKKKVTKKNIIPTIRKNVKKNIIPEAVRKSVWNKYIGRDFGVGQCYIDCGEEISRSNFECGHIISDKEGGEAILPNLRPICSNCNRSIGKKNMFDFYKKNGFKQNISNKKISKKIRWKGYSIYFADGKSKRII